MHVVKAAGIAPRYACTPLRTPARRRDTLLTVKLARLIPAALAVAAVTACRMDDRTADDRENLRQRLALSQRLLEIADEAHSSTDQTVVQALLEKDSPEHLASAQRMHSHVSTIVRSLALTQSPEQSIVRMYVWVRLAEWACHNRVEANPELVPDNCSSIFPSLRQHIDSVAMKVIDAEKLRHLDGLVERYQERHPKQLTIGLMRIDDMADHLPAEQMILERAAPTMFSPVSDAAREIEQTRILGGQLVWLMARMPTTVGDEVDSSLRGILESQRIHQVFEGAAQASEKLSNAGRILQELAHANENLTTNIGTLATAIDGIGGSVAKIDAPRDLINRALIGGGVIAFASVAGAVGGAMIVLRRLNRDGGQRPGARGSA